MKIDLYDSTGKKQGDVSLDDRIFGVKVNTDLMHRAVVMRLANARNPIAHAKTRTEVAKTTAKAFKQKGTGRARRGALSTSLVRGGGVTHGPRNLRNFSKAMPKKERRLALFSSLSVKAGKNDIFALTSFESKEPKTKTFVELLNKLPKAKKYLFILSDQDVMLKKSASNVESVKLVSAGYLNPYDVLNAEKVCILKSALEKIEKTFLPSE